jgi:hypothetical protein
VQALHQVDRDGGVGADVDASPREFAVAPARTTLSSTTSSPSDCTSADVSTIPNGRFAISPHPLGRSYRAGILGATVTATECAGGRMRMSRGIVVALTLNSVGYTWLTID